MPRQTKKLEVRTNVVFSKEDHNLIKEFAEKRGVSFGQLVRNVLTTYIRTSKEESFFYNPPVYRGKKNAPRDMAKNHDKYLYGSNQ